MQYIEVVNRGAQKKMSNRKATNTTLITRELLKCTTLQWITNVMDEPIKQGSRRLMHQSD